MSVPILLGNDWSAVSAPALGTWHPEHRVSVVIPAYNCQPSLDLVLAALSRQTYPADLMEVVVVDDGSQPPLEVPAVRPRHCRIVPVADHSGGWGRANAISVGVAQSTGEIILCLDADMVVFPGHVEAHARWHHVLPYAVTMGDKRFADVAPGSPGWPAAETVTREPVERLFDVAATEPHDYIEEIYRRTDDLRAGDHLTFMAHAGATVALRRELYGAAGGLDTRLHLGEDTEFGYRLAQAGAVFIPERQAGSWHLGRSHMMRDAERLQRYNRPFLADRMPYPRWLRRVGGTVWAVPLVTVVIDTRGQVLEVVRAAVDAILEGDEPDVRVLLIGPWTELTDDRRSALADPHVESRLIAETFRSEPRVRLVEEAPATAFPSPYLLTIPPGWGLARTAVRRLVGQAEQHQAGLVRVTLPGGAAVELLRTAALSRARWGPAGHGSATGATTAGYGSQTLSPAAVGVADLTLIPPRALIEGAGPVAAETGGWLPATVEVGGVKSLVRAAAVVARLTAARARARVRRLVSGGGRRGI